MQHGVQFIQANERKADFDNIYDCVDPRPYFTTLRRLDYQIPQNAKPQFQEIFDDFRRIRGRDALRVLDVGCSYGINAGLLKYDLELADLYGHYCSPSEAGLTPSELRRNDRRFFAANHSPDDLEILGIDAAANAVDYAKDVGLLDAGVVSDLEESSLDDSAIAELAGFNIIISTGCVGYVTEATFERLLAVCDASQPPWVVSFVLRMFPYGGIAQVLARHGLATVRYKDRTFIQRRFADRAEQSEVIAQLESRGIATDGLEDEGWLHAELFVSMPAEELQVARPGFPDRAL